VTLQSPLWMHGLDYDGFEDRQIFAGIGDSGVLGSGSLAVSQRGAGANMSVDVATGWCIIPGPLGNYLCRNDGIENVPIAAAPSPGNSRIDVIYARARDAHAEGSGSDQDWIIDKVTGTPSGSPSAPSIPTYAIELARVTLTSATSSITNGIITNTRRHSRSLSDGVWPVIGSHSPSDTTQGSGVVTWGSVTIPAPNRQVKVLATMSCYAVCDTGDTLAVPTLALRITHSGGTQAATSPVKALSPSEFEPVPLSRHTWWNITPTTGTDILVEGRVQSETGGDADFVNGILVVQVFPA
jgi:hypothetical protein